MPKRLLRLPLEISSVDRSNLISALEVVRGCLKTTSMLWMRALGLPVLSGVVIEDWSGRSVAAVRRFTTEHEFSELLLRIDKQSERWTSRRGGYLIPTAEVGETIEQLHKEGFIAALLEPVNPYSDQYSLAGVTIPEQRKLIVEIVGPGFDASDILRSDVSVHERWECKLELTSKSGLPDSTSRVNLITQEEYQASVQQRLAKIGARIKNPAFPEEVSTKRQKGELVEDAIAFLKASRQTLLLRHSDAYVPIPEKHLSAFSRLVTQLLAGLAGYGIHLGSSSFAASVIPKRGLVFWDFFPAKKQETASLYPAA